jgi:universal stress protein A
LPEEAGRAKEGEMAAIKRILVPTDFSVASGEALRYARALADGTNASLCILHAIDNQYLSGGYMEYYAPPVEYFEQVEREARKSLDALLTPEEQARYGATLVLRSGAPAHEILAHLREDGDIDLVVMATHGRGGVGRLMMGSVTDKIVRAAPCPVLTIRVHEQSAEHGRSAA